MKSFVLYLYIQLRVNRNVINMIFHISVDISAIEIPSTARLRTSRFITLLLSILYKLKQRKVVVINDIIITVHLKTSLITH